MVGWGKKEGTDMVDRICRTCKSQFKARQADIDRGWALFCSKSCKAVNQAKNNPTVLKTSKYRQRSKFKRHDGKSPMNFKFCYCGDNAINGVYTITGIEWLCETHMDNTHCFSSDALGQWE